MAPKYIRASFTGLLLASASVSWAASSAVTIDEPDAWIIETESPDHSLIASPDASDGVFYRLVDRQVNTIDTKDRSIYSKIEYQFTNQSGVQDSSTITIDFDPTYESIVVHQLGIVRNAVYIDKLLTTELQVLRTEADLDELFYNGTETLTAILEDVRVGDILSYSYTRKGENPVFDDLIEYSTHTQHHIPMAVKSFRMLASENQPLYIRKRDTADDIEINRSTSNGVQQISWSQRNLVPMKWVDDEPNWTRIKPSFAVSSVKNSRGFDLIADETRHYLNAPKAPQYRKRPYALGYPNIVEEVNVIKFDRNIKHEIAEETISNDYFTYAVTVNQNDKANTLIITHKYESHALSVPPKDIKQFSRDMDSAWEISSIYVPDSGLDWSEDEKQSKAQSWASLFVDAMLGR